MWENAVGPPLGGTVLEGGREGGRKKVSQSRPFFGAPRNTASPLWRTLCPLISWSPPAPIGVRPATLVAAAVRYRRRRRRFICQACLRFFTAPACPAIPCAEWWVFAPPPTRTNLTSPWIRRRAFTARRRMREGGCWSRCCWRGLRGRGWYSI